ncbi:hypothetical protein CRM22_004592, partial [Opisthorchis felineus]
MLSDLEIRDVTVEVLPNVVRTLRFEMKSRYGSSRQTSVYALNSLFELRKDLDARWLDPLKGMKPVADKCLWIDDDLGQIVFSVYFDISNLKERTFNTYADQLSELKNPVYRNSETDIYIQQLLYSIPEGLKELDEKKFCDVRFEEDTNQAIQLTTTPKVEENNEVTNQEADDNADYETAIHELSAIKITPAKAGGTTGRSVWDLYYEKRLGHAAPVHDVCDLLMNNLHQLEYGCNGPLVACAQEPRNQPATDRTTATLYYRMENVESRETCLANIVQKVSDTINSVVGGAQMTVTSFPEIVKAIKFVLEAGWGTSKITTTALNVTSKVLFELRKDLFSRWFSPLAGVEPFAANCILTKSDRFSSTVLMSAYFNANEKNTAQIAEMERQVRTAADEATGEEETENFIHVFGDLSRAEPGEHEDHVCEFISAESGETAELTDGDNNNGNVVTGTDDNYDSYEEEVDEKDTEETTTEEGTNSEPEVSTDGGVDDLENFIQKLSAIKITPLISAVSSSPWDRLYKKLSNVSTKPYDVCDLLMPTLRTVKLECSAALVACSQEPRNKPADQGTTVTLYYRLPPAELKDTCIQGVVRQVDDSLSDTEDVEYLSVSSVPEDIRAIRYVLRTEWETSKQTGDTPVPTAKVIFDLRKDLFERWLTTSGDIKPLAINCLWTMASISKVMWMSMYFDFEKFAEIEDVEAWIEDVLDQRGDSIASEDYVDNVMDHVLIRPGDQENKFCEFVPEPTNDGTSVATSTPVPTSPIETLDGEIGIELPETNEGTQVSASTTVDLPTVPTTVGKDTLGDLPGISLVTKIPVTEVVATSSPVGTVVSVESVNKSLNEVFLNKSVSDIKLATNESTKQPIHLIVKNLVGDTYGRGSATTTITTSTPVATSPVGTPDGG